MSDAKPEEELRPKTIGPLRVWGTTVAGPILMLLVFNEQLRDLGPANVLAAVAIGFLQHALVVELTVGVSGGGSSFSFARAFLSRSWGRAAGLAELWTMALLMAVAGIFAATVAYSSGPATVVIACGAFVAQLVRPRGLAGLWALLSIVVVLGAVAVVAAAALLPPLPGESFTLQAPTHVFKLGSGWWLMLIFVLTPLMPFPADETSMSQERLARVGLISSLTIGLVAVLLALVPNDTIGSVVLEKFKFKDDLWVSGVLALSLWSLTWRAATTAVRVLSRSRHVSEYWSVVSGLGPHRASLWTLVLATVAVLLTGVVGYVVALTERIIAVVGLVLAPFVFRTVLMAVSYLASRILSRGAPRSGYSAPFGVVIASGVLLASLGAIVVGFVTEGGPFDPLILVMVLFPAFLWCKSGGHEEPQSEALVSNR